MIDNPEKTASLMVRLSDALPIRARATPGLIAALRTKNPKSAVPPAFDIVEIHYAGDVGGILCCLDFGDGENKVAHIVSITHLLFDRTVPLAREIEAYQRHRMKKIRQEHVRSR